MKNAQVGWPQIVGIILAVVVIIVAIVVYTTIIKTSGKDITKCGSFGLKGECRSNCLPGESQSATFSSSCPDERPICCIKQEK